MKERPVERQAPIITKQMFQQILFGGLFVAITSVAFLTMDFTAALFQRYVRRLSLAGSFSRASYLLDSLGQDDRGWEHSEELIKQVSNITWRDSHHSSLAKVENDTEIHMQVVLNQYLEQKITLHTKRLCLFCFLLQGGKVFLTAFFSFFIFICTFNAFNVRTSSVHLHSHLEKNLGLWLLNTNQCNCF